MGIPLSMNLNPILAEKLSVALAPATPALLTPRDTRLPAVPGKVHAVIGMRRAGKTTRLLTLTRDAMPAQTPSDIIVQPAYEWMLAPGK